MAWTAADSSLSGDSRQQSAVSGQPSAVSQRSVRESPDPGFDGPAVGKQAPEFFIDTPSGRCRVGELAVRVGTLVLVSIDSYRYHPG